MIYELKNGTKIDTAKQLDFEERNFLQKMMIYQHLGMSAQDFGQRWRKEGNPAWKGPETLSSQSPVVLILLDIEQTLAQGKDAQKDASRHPNRNRQAFK
jgi:hypothetical protein